MTNELFFEYCKNGHIDKVIRYLNHPDIDPTFDDNKSLFIAIINGEEAIINILLSDYRILSKLTDIQIKKLITHTNNILLQYLDKHNILFKELKYHIQYSIKHNSDSDLNSVMKYILDNKVKLI